MKRLIALIISASLLLQIAGPTVSMVTYAKAPENTYLFKWERTKSLGNNLIEEDSKTDENTALVSWKPGTETGEYSLEYFIENLEGTAQKVELVVNRPSAEQKAEVGIKIFDKDDQEIAKTYEKYNPDLGSWVSLAKDEVIAVQSGSTYPGGGIRVSGDMEIWFKWSLGTMYVQVDRINLGNITEFTLSNRDKAFSIDVLAGLDGYEISPIHIDWKDGKIADKLPKDMLEGEYPGSKPGVKIAFNRPKKLDPVSFKFETLGDAQAAEIGAELDISPLIGVSPNLKFNLKNNANLEGFDNIDKELLYDDNTYTFYIAKDDVVNGQANKNVVKWDELEPSMILKDPRLGLYTTDEDGVEKSLGFFWPKVTSDQDKEMDIGRYTYLEYSIERKNLSDAYIEVRPYSGLENTDIWYIVERKFAGEWEPLVKHQHKVASSKDDTPIRIPIPFSPTDDPKEYRLKVNFSLGNMFSQELHYKAKDDLEMQPPTPSIQSVDNVYAVPPEKLGDQPEAIGFDLTWTAPKNSEENPILDNLLDRGDLYYELFLHEDSEAKEGTGTLINIFKLSKDTDINPEPYGGTAGKTPPKTRYNPSNATFTMENIVLKNQVSKEDEALEEDEDLEQDKPDQDGWEQITMPAGYESDTQYPQGPDGFKVSNDMPSKEVPGIYYLRMRAVYDTAEMTTGAGITMGVKNTYSPESSPKSITISPLEEVIPVPTKLESQPSPEKDSDVVRQLFSWGNISLARYRKQMLDPLNLFVDGEGVHEVYLYQKKGIGEAEFNKTAQEEATIKEQSTYKLTDANIDALREGKAIRLDYQASSATGINKITFHGLDENQVYYTTVRVRLDIQHNENENFKDTRYSVISKEHSFTSGVNPSEPGPGERTPPVPEKLKVIGEGSNTVVKIGWQAPDYTQQKDEQIYFEMLRVDGKELDTEDHNRTSSIKELLEAHTEGKMWAWRTRETLVEKYTKSLAKPWEALSPPQPSAKLELEDSSLSPNKYYYYYVRTVLIVGGEERYSSWVGIPVTTLPVQKPIQLKVEGEDRYNHLPKTQVVVSFLAQIPKGAQIPQDYDFDIAVKGEDDEDYDYYDAKKSKKYSSTRVPSIEDDKNIPAGYSHYTYKITGLKPGKAYDIKVNLMDKTIPVVDGEHPQSLYSDKVRTRTHFDQDEQDKDDKFEAYLKYFEDKVEALRRKPYWVLEDGTNNFSIKYRSDHMVPEVNGSQSYKLDVREGVTNFTYHMPASVIEATNQSQTSFEITQGDVSYSVRPSTITSELEALKLAREDINSKYIRDYYVAFNFSQSSSGIRTGFLTPEISVDIELVRLKEEDRLIEADIMIDLNNRINKEKEYFIDDLERALDRGKILDEELQVIIDRSLDEIQRKHELDVRSIISSNTRRITSIDKWNKDMLIMARTQANVIAQGYLLGWQDTALTTFNTGQGYGIEISHSGTYAFKGQKINMPVIPGVPGAGDLITKYKLTDFFGVNATINPKASVSKRNVLGAMARVLGAPRGADYMQYLKQMNIKGMSNIGMDLSIKKGEGIYLLMQVYEKTHNKPINAIYIKNRNALSNIRSFNQLHQPYVLVAVDSKLISTPSGIRPNDPMEIKDIVEILTNIMATVR